MLNKVDVADRGQLAADPQPLSARRGRSAPTPARASTDWPPAVSQALSHSFLDVDVETGVENGRLLAYLASHGEVLSKRYTDSRVIVHCRIPAAGHGPLARPMPTSGRTAAATGRSMGDNGSRSTADDRTAARCDQRQSSIDRGEHEASARRTAALAPLRLRALLALYCRMARRRIAGLRGILTGASSGIGRALAELLGARRGTAGGRRPPRRSTGRVGRLSSPDAPGEIDTLAGDVTDPSVRQAAIDRACESFGGLDLLVNNAGSGAMGRFDEASPERLRQIMDVNFFAAGGIDPPWPLPLLKQGQSADRGERRARCLGHRGVPGCVGVLRQQVRAARGSANRCGPSSRRRGSTCCGQPRAHATRSFSTGDRRRSKPLAGHRGHDRRGSGAADRRGPFAAAGTSW